MAANTQPIFIKQGNFFPVRMGSGASPQVPAANAASDGTGTLGTNIFELLTATTDGTRVDGVRFRNSSNTATASQLMVHRVFLTDATGVQSTARLIGEVQTTAGANRATAGNVGATSSITFDQPLILRSGQKLLVSQSLGTTNADLFDAIAFGGDY